jgi:hypothetical protein
MLDFISETLRFNADFVELVTDFILENPISMLFYFAPSLFALIQNKYNFRVIFICNLIAGFTGISWFVILIWAIVAPENKPEKPQIAQLCPFCRELIRPLSTACHHCHRSLKSEDMAGEVKSSVRK